MTQPTASTGDESRPNPWYRGFHETAFWLLILIVACGYLWRLPTYPIHGEESRWARGAEQMIETGDYIVPRQQGKVFPERPPMNSWLMVAASWIRGDVDVWAVRLPSVLAVVLTAGCLYLYTRLFLPAIGAFSAGAIYATFGQVLQIGRLGESEAVLAFFVTAALLTWHAGFYRRWNPAVTWSIAYSFAAMAALTKGLQGPVYLGAASVAFLAWRRDWKWLFGWQHALGIGCGVGIVALWQIPFFMATDIAAVKDIWTGLVVDRITWQGLLSHLAMYPLETLACLLPWSLMAIQLLHPRFRRRLMTYRDPLQFVVLAAVIAYPSVWLVTGARGRYYMPLYGCLAVSLAFVVYVSLAGSARTWELRGWNRFARCSAVALAVVAAGLCFVGAVPQLQFSGVAFPLGWSLALLAISGIACWFGFQRQGSQPDTDASLQKWGQLVAITCGLCVVYGVVAPAIALKHGHHVRNHVAEVRDEVPSDHRWVSFGPIHHRFVYHLNESVEELDWPSDPSDVPPDVDYFLLDYNVWDSPERRLSGRGRSWGMTPGTLPFEWDEVMRVPMDRSYMESESWVILGRIRRNVSQPNVEPYEPDGGAGQSGVHIAEDIDDASADPGEDRSGIRR